MSTIIQLLTKTYEDWLTPYQVGRQDLQAVLTEMNALGTPQVVKSNIPPVVKQYLAQAAELVPSQFGTLSKMFLQMAPNLDWVTPSPEYGGAQFANCYAFARLIGPALSDSRPTLYASQKICVGMTLQAPYTYYFPHKHKTVEFYGVLGGTALWQMGNEGWNAKPPGTLIYHRSNVFHAMQTQAEPLLTTYAWVGDIFSPIETA